MTQEALAPTPERMARSQWDRPETSQATNRRAYRARDPFLEMLRLQQIDGNQFQRSELFERAYHGADGHDVRVQDYVEIGGTAEYSRTFWATSLADARRVLSVKEFEALELMVRDGADLVSVGKKFSSYKTAGSARAYGLAMIQTALQRLVDEWKIKRREPPSR